MRLHLEGIFGEAEREWGEMGDQDKEMDIREQLTEDSLGEERMKS